MHSSIIRMQTFGAKTEGLHCSCLPPPIEKSAPVRWTPSCRRPRCNSGWAFKFIGQAVKTIAKFDTWIDSDGKLFEDKAILIIGWARDGLTDTNIAHNIGVSYSTFREWKKKYPSLSAALKNGQEVADYVIENALYEKAKGGDTTAMIFWLKNRKPSKWRDHPVADADEAQLAKAKEILGGVDSAIN